MCFELEEVLDRIAFSKLTLQIRINPVLDEQREKAGLVSATQLIHDGLAG